MMRDSHLAESLSAHLVEISELNTASTVIARDTSIRHVNSTGRRFRAALLFSLVLAIAVIVVSLPASNDSFQKVFANVVVWSCSSRFCNKVMSLTFFRIYA